jgi:hypothetical protein
MGDFKVLARGFDVITGWLVEDEASVDDRPATPVCRCCCPKRALSRQSLHLHRTLDELDRGSVK